jgi:nitrogen fixation NifU-like protein
VDIRFDGEACAICISSTSIMIDLLIGKTIDEVKDIIVNYKRMINGEEYNESILGEAIVYQDINKQPNKKTCALLSWQGIEQIVGDY